MTQGERDYVLGTHDEELERLELQHRVWRPRMLDALYRAGVTSGSRVIDVGAGPGFATLDLAEIVARQGEVVSVERSSRFLEASRERIARRGLQQVRFHELDLMTDPIPATGFDAAWCRWVACFVADPMRLVHAIASSLRVGGKVVFHEYADYGTWRLAPRRPAVESFVEQVMASWREAGGEPDVALQLPSFLEAAGMRVTFSQPIIFAVHPGDYRWRWPASFLEINLKRLQELGRVDAAWCDQVQAEWTAAEADPASLLLTPMVLEIIAEKVADRSTSASTK